MILSPFGRRENVANDSEGIGHHDTCAYPLKTPEENELHHVAAEAAEERAHYEDCYSADIEPLAAIHIRQLAGNRNGDGGSDNVGCGYPGVLGESTEVDDNSGHGGTHNRLVQGTQEHSQQHAGQCDEHLSPGQSVDANPLGCYIIVICLLFWHVVIYIADVSGSVANVSNPQNRIKDNDTTKLVDKLGAVLEET